MINVQFIVIICKVPNFTCNILVQPLCVHMIVKIMLIAINSNMSYL